MGFVPLYLGSRYCNFEIDQCWELIADTNANFIEYYLLFKSLKHIWTNFLNLI